MGINGLLQQLKSISKPTHVSAYRGRKVAIDGYSWLHKGAYSCSMELCEGRWADGYVRYFLSRIEMLRSHGVVPIVIFDGCRLPMKADEEDTRRRGRREAMDRARQHAESGNMTAANECYQKAVDIAPWMAKVVIEALRERDVQWLVAPYEADAQMSYLAVNGDVHAVLTEDSDMVAYGCPRVLYKLDRSGHGEEVALEDLPSVREINLVGFSHDMLLQTCILAGCDFLPNIAGLGIKKAHALIRKHKDFVKVIRALRFGGTTIPAGYDVTFQRTVWLFRHQRVWCPSRRQMAHMRPLPEGGLGARDVLVLGALPPEGPEREALPFLGPPMEHQLAEGIARGDVDPSSLEPFDLASIYQGCKHPPQHLRPLLPHLAPTQHHSQTQAHSQGGASQHAGPASQHQQRRNSWGGATQGGAPRHAAGRGMPPQPPNPSKSIKRFFQSDPAATQPFKPPRAAGSTGVAAGTGSAAVVTLSGQPVETVHRPGTAGGGAASGAGRGLGLGLLPRPKSAPAVRRTSAGALSLGPAGGGSAGGSGREAEEVEEADGQEDEGLELPSGKRRRLCDRASADTCAPTQRNGVGSASGSLASRAASDSLFSRFQKGAAGTARRASEAGGSLDAARLPAFGAAAALQQAGADADAGGAAARAFGEAAVVDKSESRGVAEQSGEDQEGEEEQGGEDLGTETGGRDGSYPGEPSRGGLSWPGPSADGEASGQLGEGSVWTGATCLAGAPHGQAPERGEAEPSQGGSMLTHAGGSQAAGGDSSLRGRLLGRLRNPARLALESLVASQGAPHEGCDPAPSQGLSQGLGPVPSALTAPEGRAGRPRPVGALAAMGGRWQRSASAGPELQRPAAGDSQAHEASGSMSLPSPSKHAFVDPPSNDRLPTPSLSHSPKAAGAAAAAAAGHADSTAPPAATGNASLDGLQPLTSFNLYDLEGHGGDVGGSAIWAGAGKGRGSGGGPSGGLDGNGPYGQGGGTLVRGGGQESDDDDEGEVTSPFKGPSRMGPGASRHAAAGLRRPLGAGQRSSPLQLHGTGLRRRRLSDGAFAAVASPGRAGMELGEDGIFGEGEEQPARQPQQQRGACDSAGLPSWMQRLECAHGGSVGATELGRKERQQAALEDADGTCGSGDGALMLMEEGGGDSGDRGGGGMAQRRRRPVSLGAPRAGGRGGFLLGEEEGLGAGSAGECDTQERDEQAQLQLMEALERREERRRTSLLDAWEQEERELDRELFGGAVGGGEGEQEGMRLGGVTAERLGGGEAADEEGLLMSALQAREDRGCRTGTAQRVAARSCRTLGEDGLREAEDFLSVGERAGVLGQTDSEAGLLLGGSSGLRRCSGGSMLRAAPESHTPGGLFAAYARGAAAAVRVPSRARDGSHGSSGDALAWDAGVDGCLAHAEAAAARAFPVGMPAASDALGHEELVPAGGDAVAAAHPGVDWRDGGQDGGGGGALAVPHGDAAHAVAGGGDVVGGDRGGEGQERGGQQQEEEEEEDGDVEITAELCTGGGGGGFHSVHHVPKCVAVATRTLDRMERRQQQQQQQQQQQLLFPLQPRSVPPPQRRTGHGLGPSPQPVPGAGARGSSAAALGATGRGAGTDRTPLAGQLAMSAFTRALPRSTGGNKRQGGRGPGGAGAAGPSRGWNPGAVFVDLPEGAGGPCQRGDEGDQGVALGRQGGGGREGGKRGLERGEDAGAAEAAGEDDGEVEIVGEVESLLPGVRGVGGAGSQRDARAQEVLRRPFQRPRLLESGTAGAGSGPGVGGAGRGRGAAVGVRGRGGGGGAQQQAITAFGRFAYTKAKKP